MTIINRVPALITAKFKAENRKVNLSDVQQATGLTYATVHRWWKDRIDRADFDVLGVWCEYLNCTVGDMLVYKPDGTEN